VIAYDLSKHDYGNPDPWTALSLDHSTLFDPVAKAALMRNNRSFSRRFLLPVVRVVARLAVVLTQLLRIVVPDWFAAPKLLHRSIAWGMTTFVRPDANYLILRHFHIGTQMLRFIADNVGGLTMKPFPLRPLTIAALADNVFVQHDLNIYNFIIEVNAQLNAQGRAIGPRPLAEMDFSAIEDFDHLLQPMPRRWHNFIDIQSAIELYTPLYSLLLTHDDFNRASHSLQLDETIAIYVARMFDTVAPIALVNNRHPVVPFSTVESGFRLMLHGIDAEQLYGFVKTMRDLRAHGGVVPIPGSERTLAEPAR
jgi:hypothetical protein